ncbi:hypothetical protein [Celeribacter sp.]|uniref:hypothetical protein n=1 Tax=Celeribacter sp. TaxID=1890673 RepID=UPI003A8F97F2
MSDLNDFLRDVRHHKLTIELDQGVHRCLFLGHPGSSSHHYRLTTWPGHLAISGDMGSFMFVRRRDMFDFFRDEEMTNKINPSYWSQKTEAIYRHGGMKVFSPKIFEENVREFCGEWEVNLRNADRIKSEVERELCVGFSDQSEAFKALRDFESSDGYVFDAFDFPDCTEHSFHFIWCLRAIVWGIKQYDLVTQGRTQADHTRRVLAGEI